MIKNLTQKQKDALEKIAKVSKMDCWFSIDELGVWDLENSTRMDINEAVIQLADGATYSDILHAGPDAAYELINLLLKIVK